MVWITFHEDVIAVITNGIVKGKIRKAVSMFALAGSG